MTALHQRLCWTLLVAAVASCGRDWDSFAFKATSTGPTDGSPPTPSDASDDSDPVPASCASTCVLDVPSHCEEDVCVIDCSAQGACPRPIVCPPGVACTVSCGTGACTGGVECRNSERCSIQCTGQNACAGPVVCSGTSCDVECGSLACRQGVQCNASEDCAVSCTKNASCAGPIALISKNCDTRCTGPNACSGSLTSQASEKSNVNCTGANACGGAIRCSGEGTCAVNCGASACEKAVCCEATTCNITNSRNKCR